ncbi:hypothetical protein AGRI_00705 [Alishewanella agri BL06]|uniref:PEP-CTERM system TPR-repeat lipoprotein n=1 Tax=Alishewanella agri BL06 TaxID=1195246 RepID=I8UAR8_9ALTE|nr:XrtA/PEP-CTERM system TPR-repeat protein PrsT [Alishewanella agri]EIW90346.1 hypothetical protein AGRI_00705 [Alishewanella agri BL06]
MKKTYLPAAIALSIILSGCGGKSAEEHFASATEFAQQQRFNEAVIELKSAVAAAPDNGDYRVLLGRIYMQTGDYISAEKELLRAIANGIALPEIAQELIQTRFRSENYKQLLEPMEGEDTLSDSLLRYLSFYRALTEIEMGTGENALPTFDKLVDAPEPDLQQFAKAMLHIRNNAAAEALATLEAIDANSNTAAENLLFRAQLQSSLGKEDAALALYYDYLKLVPTALRSRLSVAQLELKNQELDKARAQLEQIMRFAPEHGLTNYLSAIVAYEQKDFNKAKEYIDRAIANRFSTTASRILAGIIYNQLGLNSQALAHLATVQSQLGVYPPAQRLYTALQLQAGELTSAAGSLSTTNLTADDVNLAAATAFQLLRAGETNLANDILRQMEDAGLAQDSRALTAMGQLKLGIPEQMTAGIRDLEQALLIDPARHDARLTLAASYIRQQQYDKASALADEWLKQPETANTGYNLKALTAMLSANFTEAEKFLNEAEQADAKNAFTQYLLAAVAQQQEQPDQAIALLQKAVNLQPDYVPAYLGLYGINKSLNKETSPIIAQIQAAQQKAPDNQGLLGLLLTIYQQEQQFDAIVALLEPKLSDNTGFPVTGYPVLANAYVNQQKLPQALAVTERWFKQDERNQQAALAYANILALNKRMKEALAVVDNLRKRLPNDTNIKLVQLALLNDSEDYPAALAVLEQLPKEISSQPQMLFHKGRMQLLAGQLALGLKTLQDSYNAVPDSLTAIAIAEALARDVSFRRAIRFLEDHFAKHGQDQRVYSFYGSLVLQDDVEKAREIYFDIFQKDPENPLILNNYAWVLAQSGEAQKALPYAEKALGKLPQHPDILDTYGKILKLQGQHKEAIVQFEKSLAIRPNHPEVQLNYAESLIQIGNTVKAREVLNSINAGSAEHKARQQQLSASL